MPAHAEPYAQKDTETLRATLKDVKAAHTAALAQAKAQVKQQMGAQLERAREEAAAALALVTQHASRIVADVLQHHMKHHPPREAWAATCALVLGASGSSTDPHPDKQVDVVDGAFREELMKLRPEGARIRRRT